MRRGMPTRLAEDSALGATDRGMLDPLRVAVPERAGHDELGLAWRRTTLRTVDETHATLAAVDGVRERMEAAAWEA